MSIRADIPMVNCRDCRFARAIQTNWQWARNKAATYAVCHKHFFLVRPSSDHGCGSGEKS